MHRLARLQVTLELLHEMFDLPEEVSLCTIAHKGGPSMPCDFVLEGKQFSEVIDGSMPPIVGAEYDRGTGERGRFVKFTRLAKES